MRFQCNYSDLFQISDTGLRYYANGIECIILCTLVTFAVVIFSTSCSLHFA